MQEYYGGYTTMIRPWILFYRFLHIGTMLVCVINLGEGVVTELAVACTGPVCLHLFDTENQNKTWQESLDYCASQGLMLARIESQAVQEQVEQVMEHLTLSTYRRVWVAGRGSREDIWRDMDGSDFRELSELSDGYRRRNCLAAVLTRDVSGFVNLEYQADNCYERDRSTQLVCQYDSSTTECSAGQAKYGDKCIIKTLYNGGETNRISWFDGQTYCSSNYPGGSIIYSDIEKYASSFFNLLVVGQNSVRIWLGVHKRIWHWRTATNSDARQTMTYFNWYGSPVFKTSFDQCVFIAGGADNKWRTELCDDKLRLFLCMSHNYNVTTIANLIDPTTTIEPPTDTEKTTNSVRPTDASSRVSLGVSPRVSSGSSPGGKLGGDLTVIVLSAVLAVVVLGVIIGLSIYCVRSRQKKAGRSSDNVNIRAADDGNIKFNSGVDVTRPADITKPRLATGDAAYEEINLDKGFPNDVRSAGESPGTSTAVTTTPSGGIHLTQTTPDALYEAPDGIVESNGQYENVVEYESLN